MPSLVRRHFSDLNSGTAPEFSRLRGAPAAMSETRFVPERKRKPQCGLCEKSVLLIALVKNSKPRFQHCMPT